MTVKRHLSAGQRKQLNYEWIVAKDLKEVEWDVRAFHDSDPVLPFEEKVPKLFRGLILRNLYAWLYLIKKKNKYDVILYRHLTFDPFVLFLGWFVRNRISIHHSKEIDELKIVKPGWRGQLASLFERFTGVVSARQALGILAVTKDIELYQRQINRSVKNSSTYPNAVLFEHLHLLDDKRDPSAVSVAFVCGQFSNWHGLDLLLLAAKENLVSSVKLKIYLIGKLTENDVREIESINEVKEVFVIMGFMDAEEYTAVLSRCDAGLASFAMYREGLYEGATLKVREYLAQGLPVFSGHKDTSLPADFPFYTVGVPDLEDMVRFARKMKSISRADVRSRAFTYLDKKKPMVSVIDWLGEL